MSCYQFASLPILHSGKSGLLFLLTLHKLRLERRHIPSAIVAKFLLRLVYGWLLVGHANFTYTNDVSFNIGK